MQTQFLALGGGRIAYDDRGNGPLVICVPGLGDLRGEYRFLAPRLVEAGYRVVTVDLRGHGESSVGWTDYSKAAVGSDIVALIRHLNAGPAHLIGTSYAAGAAVCAAAAAPELVQSIVLIGAFVRDHAHGWRVTATNLLYSALFADWWGPWAWKGYFPNFFPTRKPEDFAAYTTALTTNLKLPGRMRAMRAMIRSGSADSEAALAGVRSAALVVMGRRDPDFKSPHEEAAWIAAQVSGSVEMIDGAGHYPHVDTPEQTATAIVTFFERISQEQEHYGHTSRAA